LPLGNSGLVGFAQNNKALGHFIKGNNHSFHFSSLLKRPVMGK